MKTTQYGLRHKEQNTILTIYKEDNGYATSCNSHTCTLSTSASDPQWLVDSPERAEYIRQYGKTYWYNTSPDQPSHEYKASDLEVVEVVITVNTTVVQASLPSYEDYMQKRIASHEKYPRDQENMRKRLDEYRQDKMTMTPETLNQKYEVQLYDLLPLKG